MDITRDASIFVIMVVILSTYFGYKTKKIIDLFTKTTYIDLSMENKKNKKKKIGLLTNELPPIIYGGVSTWVLNFMDMFKDDDEYETVPIFLAYLDKAPDNFGDMYPGIRIINNEHDIQNVFGDIDLCVNNLWIALDTIKNIKKEFPKMPIVSVCHSLIKMEHITNLGSQYTNNFSQQEVTFQNSDYVVLISKAEKEYYESFGYDAFDATPVVIYNMYTPKFDKQVVFDNYKTNNLGYIGRHVPRKRPELAIETIKEMKLNDIKVFNMGVDFNKGGNEYWKKLQKKYKDQLEIIEFTSDKKIKQYYYDNIGANICSGIYEPFGYTVCECLDRRIPLIVSNIDGPKEITESVKDYVYQYEVDKDNMDNDITNLSETLKTFYETSPEERKENAEEARKTLDNFRPQKIKKEWMKLFNCCADIKVKEEKEVPDKDETTNEVINENNKDNIFEPRNIKIKKA